MRSIYIGGDSFCYYRKSGDWPAILANKLNLKLTGCGFPGDSWWHTRQHLLQYLATKKSIKTELFVFCHTDPYRFLTSQIFFQNPDALAIKNQYLKYFLDYDIGEWTTKHWYLELNELLKNRQVIHLQCFSSSQTIFPLLSGCRIVTPLVELSLKDNETIDEWRMPGQHEDVRRNHFNPAQQQSLAQKIVDCLGSDANDFKISL